MNCEIDVRDNKVKEGMLLKQSRHLKEWKQRWMVLTKTHLYSFTNKSQFKDPTEMIPLKEVETTKSYYKDQYKHPYTFRVESPTVNLHMSAKSNDEKWSWMTAIQKMIDRVNHPDTKPDTHNLIRETLRMSTAVRQTLHKKQQKNRKTSIDFSQGLFKKLKFGLVSQTVDEIIISTAQKQQSSTFLLNNESPNNPNNAFKKEQRKQIIIQKIVKVPQIRQKIVQKIVYKDAPMKQLKNGEDSLMKILKKLMLSPGDNPRPLAQFIVYLATSSMQDYKEQVLQFCSDSDSKRFFAQIFLLMMNEQANEMNLNTYIKFVLVMYETNQQFFYASDLKALIGILLREMQMNRSQFNQYLIMLVFQSMACKSWWQNLNYRVNQIKAFVKELVSISGPENQSLASQLLQIL